MENDIFLLGKLTISIWSFSIAMLVITRGYRKARFFMTIWRVTSHGHTSRPLWTNSISVLEEVQCRIARMAPMVCSDGFKLITYHPPNTSHPLNTMIGYDWYVLQMGSNRYVLIATLISILKRNIHEHTIIAVFKKANILQVVSGELRDAVRMMLMNWSWMVDGS